MLGTQQVLKLEVAGVTSVLSVCYGVLGVLPHHLKHILRKVTGNREKRLL